MSAPLPRCLLCRLIHLAGTLAVPGLALGVLLGACGGGGGGSEPAAPAELPLALGQPGPGDPEQFVPLAVGNFWHFSGTSAGAPVDDLVSVVGTRVVNGTAAFVLNETNADGNGQALSEAVAKDANGLAVLAGDPVNDVLTRSLIPYWELRFPLTVGSSFVQLRREGLDMGRDLDGDGRNETVSVSSDVRVAATENITVPAGSFAGALRVDRTTTLSVRLSKDGSVVPATQTDSAWLARGVGWVRRSSHMSVLGTNSSADQQLDAYGVGGVVVGASVVGSPVVNGSLAAGTGVTLLWAAQPAGRYTITLAALNGSASLSVAGGTNCRSGLAAPGGAAPMDCSLDLSAAGPVLAHVQASEATHFVVSMAPAPAVAQPVDEVRSLTTGVPFAGQVGARGTSSYTVTGLAPFRYVIALSGLAQDADLHVYTDGTYSQELPCTLRAVGDVLPTPEDCTVSAAGGALYFRVSAGELNTAGAAYLLTVSSFPP